MQRFATPQTPGTDSVNEESTQAPKPGSLFQGDPKDLIPAAELAKLLGRRAATLADWRSRRTVDLPFVKIGAAVFYQRGDVWEFLRKRKVRTGAEGRLLNRQHPGSRAKRAAGRDSAVSASETASGTTKASPSDEGEGR